MDSEDMFDFSKMSDEQLRHVQEVLDFARVPFR